MKLGVRTWAGSAHDEFIQLTEGVMASETLEDPVDGLVEPRIERAGRWHQIVTVVAPEGVHRVGLVLPGHPQQHFIGLGARHGLHVDQAGRNLQLGADRAYTGPDCPPDMLELGGIPQGDYAPVPWLLSSRGWAAWVQTDGHGARFDLGDEVVISTRRSAGPLRVHVFTHATPFARLRAFLPDDARFADGTTGAQSAWAHGLKYRRSMQRALDEVHPGDGVLFGRPGWTGQQAVGDRSPPARRPTVGLLLAADAGRGHAHGRRDRLQQLVARHRWLPRRAARHALPEGAAAALGAVRLLHAADARARALRAGGVDVRRRDARAVSRVRGSARAARPYVRAAAATASRCGLPIVRPLALIEHGDWAIADAYGYGPSLWVAPVLEAGAHSVEVDLPRGDWIATWDGSEFAGGGTVTAPAPLNRIPVWVRRGALIVTYPAEHVARGLGDTPERARPLEATLWGEPACGRAAARLADGAVVRWTRGEWSVTPGRDVAFRVV